MIDQAGSDTSTERSPTPARAGWVQLQYSGPDKAVQDTDVQDEEWYLMGGHQPPDKHRGERKKLAQAQLQQWIERMLPLPAGRYQLTVTEYDPDTGRTTGRVWAVVSAQLTGNQASAAGQLRTETP